MINKKRLQEKADRYGIILEDVVLDQLDVYAELLVEWNQKMNLTAISQPEGIEDKHFIDSLLFAAQPEVTGRVLDVGTGAGFPGVVTKLYVPQIQLTLLEPTAKRVRFLEALLEKLQIKATLVCDRAEMAGKGTQREKYDVVTARAVAGLPLLCEYCLPLVKVGGVFVAMKGENAQEIQDAANAIDLLGAELGACRRFQLPDGSARTLVLIHKIKPTPPKYPRGAGRIAKLPL